MPSLILWFIPPSIKAKQHFAILEYNDPYPRSILIIAVFIVSIVANLLTNLYFYAIAGPALSSIITANTALGVGIYLIGLLLPRMFDWPVVALANAYALGTFLILLSGNLITGMSWSSPNLSIVLFIPIWAFLLGGNWSGIIWSFAAAGMFIGLYWLEPLGIDFPQVFPLESLNEARLIGWLTSVLLIAVCLVAYLHSYAILSARLSAERSHYAHQAEHDSLTGLANRKLFYKRIDKALDFAIEEKLKAAIIYVDLNDFKPVNDKHGHQAGDEVLIAIAHQLKANVRSSDTVARLGGDEFGVVLDGINDTATINRVVQKLSDALIVTMNTGGETLTISASIGLSIAPDDGVDIESLMQVADSEMYKAKQASKKLRETES